MRGGGREDRERGRGVGRMMREGEGRQGGRRGRGKDKKGKTQRK